MQRTCRYQTADMFGKFVACFEVTRAHIVTNLGTVQGTGILVSGEGGTTGGLGGMEYLSGEERLGTLPRKFSKIRFVKTLC